MIHTFFLFFCLSRLDDDDEDRPDPSKGGKFEHLLAPLTTKIVTSTPIYFTGRNGGFYGSSTSRNDAGPTTAITNTTSAGKNIVATRNTG